ncbi:MAG: TolC family protein [Deltaproteobacteria bacterium]|nr:TolC family protein [Deltaproteobacteria bacterium]
MKLNMRYGWLCLTALFLGFSLQAAKIEVDLEEAITLALKKNPEIREKKELIGVSKGQLEEAKAAQWPKLETLSFLAPMYKITGNALGDTKDRDSWSYFFRSEGKGYVPLYTFEKISSFKMAASNKIQVDTLKTEETAHEVVYKTKEYYYSFQLAWTLTKEGDNIMQKIDKIINKAEDLVKKETGEVTRVDLYKLRVFKSAGLSKLNKAQTGQGLAQNALKMQIGFNRDADFDIKKHRVQIEKADLQSLDDYADLALKNRPEMGQLKHGLMARDALVKAERASYFPMIALGFKYAAATAPLVQNQQSYFAYDIYNEGTVGAALAFKWDLDFLTTRAKIQQLKAEHSALLAKNEYAVRGIPMQVRKAYSAVEEQAKNIEYSKEGKKYAEKWFLQSGMGTAFGIGEVKEVLESAAAIAMMTKDYYMALFDYNMALSELTKVVGKEVTHLQY